MKLLISIAIFLFSGNYALAALIKTNPDISLNILLLGQKSFPEEQDEEESASTHQDEEESASTHKEHQHHLTDGVTVQEIELYFKSNIDPYWTGNISLGLAQHGSHFDLDLETAYIDSLFIPNFTLKIGKFYSFLGRHNTLHSHYYPFIDPPLVNQKLFGFHGLNGVGASLAYLSPLPWYSEIVIQTIKEEQGYQGLVFFKNFWDLTDYSTLELNFTYARGINHIHTEDRAIEDMDEHSHSNEELKGQLFLWENLYNLALTWKWQALDNLKSINWTTEALVFDQKSGGLNSYLQFKFLKNWWMQGRADFFSEDFNKTKKLSQKYSALLALTASEYSAIRLQADMIKTKDDWSYTIALQTNMSLGAHPAHLY